MSIAEIENAIKNLPKEKLAEFDQWYKDFCEDQWDEQIRQDLSLGKLNFLLKEVQQAEESQTLKRFP